MLYKLCAVFSLLFLRNVVFGKSELDMDFPKLPNIYWYNVTGTISESLIFACSILTNSTPTVIWMNEGNLLTDLWKESKRAEIVFSFYSWQDCACTEVHHSETDKRVENLTNIPQGFLGFSTFDQVTVSFNPSEILRSSCLISQNTQETTVFQEYDITEFRENFIPRNTGNENIIIDEMEMIAASDFDDKVYTCYMSDVFLGNEYLKTDERLVTDAPFSSSYHSNCSDDIDCAYNLFLECSEGQCECIVGYIYDDSLSKCKYNYYLNITVAAIAFSVLLGLMFLVWCVTMIIRSYHRRPGTASAGQNLDSLSTADPTFEITGPDSRTCPSSSIDLPPAYIDVERSETPPPTFESIYSMDLKVVSVTSETSSPENPVADIYAICLNENTSNIQDNSAIKIDTT